MCQFLRVMRRKDGKEISSSVVAVTSSFIDNLLPHERYIIYRNQFTHVSTHSKPSLGCAWKMKNKLACRYRQSKRRQEQTIEKVKCRSKEAVSDFSVPLKVVMLLTCFSETFLNSGSKFKLFLQIRMALNINFPTILFLRKTKSIPLHVNISHKTHY